MTRSFNSIESRHQKIRNNPPTSRETLVFIPHNDIIIQFPRNFSTIVVHENFNNNSAVKNMQLPRIILVSIIRQLIRHANGPDTASDTASGVRIIAAGPGLRVISPKFRQAFRKRGQLKLREAGAEWGTWRDNYAHCLVSEGRTRGLSFYEGWRVGAHEVVT